MTETRTKQTEDNHYILTRMSGYDFNTSTNEYSTTWGQFATNGKAGTAKILTDADIEEELKIFFADIWPTLIAETSEW